MRSDVKILVVAAASLLLAPQLAMGGDIEEQLRLMNERMGQLESQLQDTQGQLEVTQGELQATQDELEASKTTVAAQQDLIQKAGLEREAKSGLSAFLSQTEFDGFVAASYTYNFIGTDVTRQEMEYDGVLNGTTGSRLYHGINRGALGLTAPLHPNNNTFQVDQVWFGMRKPATAESRGGWAVDLVWGVAADNIGTPINAEFGHEVATGDMPHLFQAYVEYLAPLGDTFIKAGRFETLIGAELFRQDHNYNVTRGLLWALQPDNHTGLLVGSEYDNGLTWTVGIANSYSATMADSDHEKTFIGQLGYRGDSFAVLVNGLYGGNPTDVLPFREEGSMRCQGTDSNAIANACEGFDADSVALIDVVAKWHPIESVSTWINFDYYWFNNSGNGIAVLPYDFDRMNIYGISTGARWGFLESTGLAVRFEWLRAEYHPLLLPETGAILFGSVGQDADFFSITGTLDHALSENLSVRLEGRYDWADINVGPDNFFSTARSNSSEADYTRDGQGLGLVEMMYRF
jgi:hypothetical protein